MHKQKHYYIKILLQLLWHIILRIYKLCQFSSIMNRTSLKNGPIFTNIVFHLEY